MNFLRLGLSPLIFLWSTFILLVGSIFLWVPIVYSFIALLFEPFIYLLKKSGVKITSLDPFIDDTDNTALGHFLGLTIYVWFSFYWTYVYIKKGDVITL